MYWPVKIAHLNKAVLMNLTFWDTGEIAVKKFDHILPVSCFLVGSWLWKTEIYVSRLQINPYKMAPIYFFCYQVDQWM